MPKAKLIKVSSDTYKAASKHDQDQFSHVKVGAGIEIEGKRQSQRSLKMHQMYWSGLVGLCMDYWQPAGGLISASEIKTLQGFTKWIANGSKQEERVLLGAVDNYIKELTEHRMGKIVIQGQSKTALSDWLKVEAGHCVIEETPTGLVKKPKSINFTSMDQTEFNEFYKAVFTVAWNFILSREFENEEQANNAINNLQQIG